jgi:hypothetical protein
MVAQGVPPSDTMNARLVIASRFVDEIRERAGRLGLD